MQHLGREIEADVEHSSLRGECCGAVRGMRIDGQLIVDIITAQACYNQVNEVRIEGEAGKVCLRVLGCRGRSRLHLIACGTQQQANIMYVALIATGRRVSATVAIVGDQQSFPHIARNVKVQDKQNYAVQIE